MVGVRRGAVRSWFRRCISREGTRYLEKKQEEFNYRVQPEISSLVCDLPSEVELPVEATPRLVGRGDVLERLVRYHVDDGTHDGLPVEHDARQQRLQPALGTLAVSVQEGYHLSLKRKRRSEIKLLSHVSSRRKVRGNRARLERIFKHANQQANSSARGIPLISERCSAHSASELKSERFSILVR